MSNTKDDELYHYLVVKHNDLIQRARVTLTAAQQKFIAYAIAQIKPGDQEFQFYEIRVDEFCKVMGKNKDWFYKEFKNMVDDLDDDKLWVETDEKIFKFRWFSEVEYLKGKGTVRVLFNSNLKKYLLEQKERFTQYELVNIVALKSKYSHTLFEYLKSYAFRGGIVMSVDKLKYILGLDEDGAKKSSYDNFSNIRARILEPAKNEINKYTELVIDYKPITKGRKVTEIEFSVNKKTYQAQYSSYLNTMNKVREQITDQVVMSYEEFEESKKNK